MILNYHVGTVIAVAATDSYLHSCCVISTELPANSGLTYNLLAV